MASPGAEFALHVTPGARRGTLTLGPEGYRCTVTAAPGDGRANAAVTAALAHALGGRQIAVGAGAWADVAGQAVQAGGLTADLAPVLSQRMTRREAIGLRTTFVSPLSLR